MYLTSRLRKTPGKKSAATAAIMKKNLQCSCSALCTEVEDLAAEEEVQVDDDNKHIAT